MSSGADRRGGDAALVELARIGDTHAFGELVRRHGPLARQLAVRMLGDLHLAEDSVQEGTLLAYLSLTQLRSPARFGPWLCGITLNLARRCLRERRRLVLGQVAHDPRHVPDVESAYQNAELAATVRDAVSGLPRGQRDATLLFYWQGLTHQEIAAELGISAGAVKNRLHQARIALTRPLASIVDQEEIVAMSAPAAPTWIEVSVAEVRRGEGEDPSLQPHVFLLRERGGDRTLPIWVGRAEATALALTLETAEMPRPMTYQLMAALLAAARTTVREVRITRLVGHTFYAVALLDGPDGPAEVDARPSDAVNLALLTGASVLVNGELLVDAHATGRTKWHEYSTTGLSWSTRCESSTTKWPPGSHKNDHTTAPQEPVVPPSEAGGQAARSRLVRCRV